MDKSRSLFQEAQRYMPGGVNSPVRAFRSVGYEPPFIDRASGSKIYDVDGREYIDYIGSWGPMILGHACPAVVDAIRQAAGKGTSYGAPTEMEIEMAKLIVGAIPAIDMVRMVSSGTEATMSAIRLARGYTNRSRIIKFEGCYHGHADSLLVKAGSGVATLGIPGSPGVPEELAKLTITAPYNDIKAVESAVGLYGDDIACVIVEPVAGNMGVVPPVPGFLERLRTITSENGILLIFDEVITGFRLTYGGFQNIAGIEPDLTCLGKIIGGGLPVGAFGGRREIMDRLAPVGPVYQAGTLSGNPLAMAAGIATLNCLQKPGVYDALEEKTVRLCTGIDTILEKKGISHRINRMGSMFTLFFTREDVTDFASAAKSDAKLFSHHFGKMLAGGIMIAPSQFETSFVSLEHTDKDIDTTLTAFS
ncbi:MAG: glutamate-1-semialdehyde 2,1-aminomutase [Deltaproteobacteria bacterium]|nr:glutamate-1-semialdehyde 2,1-aminomutase [Deltaproteobacteria bacterium]